MPTIQLGPSPGQDSPIGGNTVISVNARWAPVLNPGDPYIIEVSGAAPSKPNIGAAIADELDADQLWVPYAGSTDGSGNLDIWGIATKAGNLSDGVLIAMGVLPPGGPVPINPMGYRVWRMVPKPPAPPPVTPGIPNLLANPGVVTEADLVAQRFNLEYFGVIYDQNVVNPALCLGDAGAARLAAALGGTVVKGPLPAKYWTDPPALCGPAPQVNYIAVPTLGKALGGDIVMALACYNPPPSEASIAALFA
jgi:hypothetical protein